MLTVTPFSDIRTSRIRLRAPSIDRSRLGYQFARRSDR
ncbi:hypothetical protein NJ7G_2940 [Natrinema sp. J7-2]|nr:hypothetical protein NJ7G_2940 [Natrinema sp. J7-2]